MIDVDEVYRIPIVKQTEKVGFFQIIADNVNKYLVGLGFLNSNGRDYLLRENYDLEV
jgi:hypothetical protein